MADNDEKRLNEFRDLEYIYKNWLHHFSEDPKHGYLSQSSQFIDQKLWDAVEAKNEPLAWQYYDQLRMQVRSLGLAREMGDVDVICARVEAKIGRLSKAQSLLQDACERYLSEDHDHAVALWMLGIVLWNQDGNHRTEAIYGWQESQECFDALCNNLRLGQERCEWYKKHSAEIGKFVESIQKQFTQSSQQAQPGSFDAASPQQAEPSPGSPQRNASEQPSGWIRFYPVLPGAVPAGKLNKIYHRKEFERLDAYEVHIGDRHYQVISLMDNDRIVDLKEVEKPYVIQVHGDSLDNYPICDGDYVIVRPVQIDPYDESNLDGRIVVTLTKADHTNINVLHQDKKTLYLGYNSKNPEYRDLSIKFKKSWKIVGIVVGLLKRIDDDSI